MELKINGRAYEARYSLRVLFKYEQLTGHPFTGDTLEESYRLLHASLLACNADYALTFDELIDACDADPSLFPAFSRELETYSARVAQLAKKKQEENR